MRKPSKSSKPGASWGHKGILWVDTGSNHTINPILLRLVRVVNVSLHNEPGERIPGIRQVYDLPYPDKEVTETQSRTKSMPHCHTIQESQFPLQCLVLYNMVRI
ncbi:hypothetical protein CW304_21190 [Bacillus sp. UFRGS-B20]|nr:hypothetical protein CW304_21190 [Bacillus sp. UFRGS-B20]